MTYTAAGSSHRNRGQTSRTTKRHLIDPARYYSRTAILFETGTEEHTWLNDVVSVGSGHLIDGGIAYQVSQVR